MGRTGAAVYMIFVNLPVRDLPTARAFYEALGPVHAVD
jgi:predicted lactoylglutathione lyase